MPKTLPAPTRRNAPWTPFQRRTWLATQRRRSRIKFEGASLSLLANLLAYYDFANSASYDSNAILDPLTVRDDGLINPLWGAATGPGGNPSVFFAGENGGTRDYQGNVLELNLIPWQADLSRLPLTVSFWLKGNSIANGEYLYGILPFSLCDSMTPADVCRVYLLSGDSYFQAWDNTGNSVYGTTGFSLLDDLWHLHTAIIDLTGITRYFDGRLIGSVAWTSHPTALWTPDYLAVGGNVWSGILGTVFDGNITQFGLWQRALSAAEVNQLYNNGDGLVFEMF